MFFFRLFNILRVVFLNKIDILFHAFEVLLIEFHALMVCYQLFNLINFQIVFFKILLLDQKTVRPFLALPCTPTLNLGIF